jgi:VWFA-related protein
VRDLTKNDFEIFEDGVAQTIDRFSLVDIPLERTEKPRFVAEPIEADVATNAREFDGRLYLLVLDDLHVAPLRTQFARKAARDFIETRLAANDQAAVVTTRGSSLDMQGFTSNRRILLETVDRFVGQKLQSETVMAVNTPEVTDLESQATQFAPGPDRIKRQRALNAGIAMTTLRNAADFMAGVRGRRKALIYISEGIDYDVYDAFSNPDSSELVASSHDAVAAATRANVAIYAIDPRGLTALGDDIAELQGQPSGAGSGAGPRSLLREQQISHDSLRELSDLTGGFASVNVSDADQAFERIVSENSSYYVFAYYTANTSRQGRTRDIDVRVRRPGVHVFSRDSYIEPRRNETPRIARPPGDVSVELMDVLRSPLPLNGLTMSATAAAFKGADGNGSVPVVVEFKGDELGLLEEGGRYVGGLDVVAWAVGMDGGAGVSQRRQAGLSLMPETYERVKEHGIRVVFRLEIPPGRYQLRVGALTPDTGLRGSVFFDLEVPDFAEDLLSMSNVVLTSAAASRVVTAEPDQQLSEMLPASPTAVREFAAGDQIDLLTEIYDNDSRPHRVDISGSVFTDTGDLVFRSIDSRYNDEFGDTRVGSYGVALTVPLAAFEPGLYVFRIQAQSRVDRSESIVREVQFRIRG